MMKCNLEKKIMKGSFKKEVSMIFPLSKKYPVQECNTSARVKIDVHFKNNTNHLDTSTVYFNSLAKKSYTFLK